jgi:hypothetical protein
VEAAAQGIHIRGLLVDQAVAVAVAGQLLPDRELQIKAMLAVLLLVVSLAAAAVLVLLDLEVRQLFRLAAVAVMAVRVLHRLLVEL